MKLFLLVAAVVVLGAGLVAGVFGHLTVMRAALVGFVGCRIAANLDRIAEFKASARGVEAKTREVIARAETAVSELQMLARIVGTLTLSLVKRSGRIGDYSDAEEYLRALTCLPPRSGRILGEGASPRLRLPMRSGGFWTSTGC
jgi:hypothetical protein